MGLLSIIMNKAMNVFVLQTVNVESQSCSNFGRKSLKERTKGSAKKAEGEII